MGPIGCPETSVRNYHYSLRNNPEERSSQMVTVHFPYLPDLKYIIITKWILVGSLPGAEWLEFKADKSLPSNAYVKSQWISIPTLPCAVIACRRTTLPV
jgi:hypothetical protein